MLANIGRVVQDSHINTADNKKVLGEVHAAAGDLKNSLNQALTVTQGIVHKLDTIPPLLDIQLQKIEVLENGVGDATTHAKQAAEKSAAAADNTDPPKTQKAAHDENIKMLGWNTVASTLAGAAVGAVLTHFTSTPPTPPQVTLQIQAAKDDNCLPIDNAQKLQTGHPITLPTGSGTVCLVLPQASPSQKNTAVLPKENKKLIRRKNMGANPS